MFQGSSHASCSPYYWAPKHREPKHTLMKKCTLNHTGIPTAIKRMSFNFRALGFLGTSCRSSRPITWAAFLSLIKLESCRTKFYNFYGYLGPISIEKDLFKLYFNQNQVLKKLEVVELVVPSWEPQFARLGFSYFINPKPLSPNPKALCLSSIRLAREAALSEQISSDITSSACCCTSLSFWRPMIPPL